MATLRTESPRLVQHPLERRSCGTRPGQPLNRGASYHREAICWCRRPVSPCQLRSGPRPGVHPTRGRGGEQMTVGPRAFARACPRWWCRCVALCFRSRGGGLRVRSGQGGGMETGPVWCGPQCRLATHASRFDAPTPNRSLRLVQSALREEDLTRTVWTPVRGGLGHRAGPGHFRFEALLPRALSRQITSPHCSHGPVRQAAKGGRRRECGVYARVDPFR
jgi:hypothetical protein